MQTRRQFLRHAGISAAALGIPQGVALAARRPQPLGVQLYTVRKQIEADLLGTLKVIHDIGYRTVETYAAQYRLGAKELRTAILDQGLTVPSAHFGYDGFEGRLEYAKELGVEYAVCSMIPKTIANSADGYKRGAAQYNRWAEQAKQMDLRFGFHNHNAEFQDFNGVTGFDVLMQETDPALVGWQMDCYWVAEAGHDPADMLRRYRKRIQSLHLKDRKAGAPVSTELGPDAAHFTEVGEGTLDWKKILRLAQTEHISDWFVEQDTTERPPLESLRISYNNLLRLMP